MIHGHVDGSGWWEQDMEHDDSYAVLFGTSLLMQEAVNLIEELRASLAALTDADEWAMPCGGCGACKWSMAGEGAICDGTGMIREVLTPGHWSEPGPCAANNDEETT